MIYHDRSMLNEAPNGMYSASLLPAKESLGFFTEEVTVTSPGPANAEQKE
jgi:hypothetical protein